ncbi:MULTISPECIES: hypothetical protein [Streptomyces]|jgi:hypothetical protein|uniref:hypothetical protein n=1 Tax=Streptomyces TaxID=1883 RepID=UPI000A3761C9|nr:hypothetical protein [Streptomyces glaucescens]
MSVTQQYLLDTYRAHHLGEAAPPQPGAHDWQVAREWRDRREFAAVLAGRPARGRLWRNVSRWSGLRPRSQD